MAASFLPPDLAYLVLSYLPVTDLYALQGVSQSLRCQTTNFLLSHCAALELPESIPGEAFSRLMAAAGRLEALSVPRCFRLTNPNLMALGPVGERLAGLDLR
eukprot:EG_transcript_62259